VLLQCCGAAVGKAKEVRSGSQNFQMANDISELVFGFISLIDYIG
jgi:hypothetical protein